MRVKLLIFLSFIVFFQALPMNAMDFMVGAKSGYYVWVPAFKELKGSGTEQIDEGDGLLYGPVLSLIITKDLSISISALMGKQTKYWTEDYDSKLWDGGIGIYTGTWICDMWRADIDSAVSYRLFGGLKIIAGYKYQYVKMDFNFTSVNEIDQKTVFLTEVIKIPAHGPALGLGYSHVFNETFFASANLTFLYMWSSWDFEDLKMVEYTPDGPSSFLKSTSNIPDESMESWQMGMNMEVSAGAIIREDLIFTLGFRFQWMKTKLVDGFTLNPSIDASGFLNDYIYGIFVSIIYVI